MLKMHPITRYTRFVALSKHSLWILVALIILIVVWIAEDNTGVNGARIVFSNIPKSGNLQNIMLKPHFQGVDAHDRPYTVIADQATQIDQDNVAMQSVRADMVMGSGAWVALNSANGTLNTKSKQVQLGGGVDMFYDNGYEFRTDHAYIDVQQGAAHSDSPVEGQGPQGTLKADSFSVEQRGKIIHFNGSVRTTLYP